MPRRPVLAYVVVAWGMLALLGAIAGAEWLLATAALFAYGGAMVESVTFVVRARHRKLPAVMLGNSRVILGATLAAMVGVLLGTGLVASHYFRLGPGHGPAVVWPLVVGILAWRAWIVPSARRAAIVQLVTIMFAMPSMIAFVAQPLYVPAHVQATCDTALFVGFIVVAAAGTVLDYLYSSVVDRGPERVPEARLR